jgi:hypothetical protein
LLAIDATRQLASNQCISLLEQQQTMQRIAATKAATEKWITTSIAPQRAQA